MAIVERQTTITRTRTTPEAESDAGTGILIVLAIVVALAAAYFAYDYYAVPANDEFVTTPNTVMMDPAAGEATTTPAPAGTVAE